MNSGGDGFHAAPAPAPYQVTFRNGLGQNYYVAAPPGGAFYAPPVSPDLGANNVYLTWPQPSVSRFDPSRPPPPITNKPPLPNSPPPERPPLPPPNTSIVPRNFAASGLPHYATSSLSRGHGLPARGVYGTRGMFSKFKDFTRPQLLANGQSPQPSTSGLQIKTPESLNEQKINSLLLGGKALKNDATKPEGNLPVVSKKKKRRPMSERLPTAEWKREDAQRVLNLEKEYSRRRGDKSIVIRFPDPKLDYEIVKGFSPSIQSVHFQNPAGPRSCIVHLKQGSEMGKIVEELNKTPFGTGFLHAEERRKDDTEDEELRINDIDPYTLYIGNLPWNTRSGDIKRMFHKAKKVDIGYAQKMKATRYGFVRYLSVDDAIEAYRKYVNELYETRSIILRFRRNNSSVTEGNQRKKKDEEITPEKNLNKDTEHENESEYENETAYTYSEWGDESLEDNKNSIFDNINLTEHWSSDDMADDNISDDNEDEAAPNLTGMIKTEPEDEVPEIGEEDLDFLGVECNVVPPGSMDDHSEHHSDASRKRLLSDSSRRDDKANIPIIPLVDGIEDNTQRTKRRKDWEEIRQEELNAKEEKPDISTLNPPLRSSPSENDANPATRPITSYGLVPMISPKKEKEEESDELEEDEGN